MSVFNGPASAIEDNRLKINDLNNVSSPEQYPTAQAVIDFLSDNSNSLINTTEISKIILINDSTKLNIKSLKLFGELNNNINPVISVYGKNLCNNIFYSAQISQNKLRVYSFTEVTSPTEVTQWRGVCTVVPVKAGQRITVSGNISGNCNDAYYSYYASYDDVRDYNKVIGEYGLGVTTVPDGANFAVIGWVTNKTTGATITFSDIQVEYGTKATLYEPYREAQTVTIPYTFAEGDILTVENGIAKVDIEGQEVSYTESDGNELLVLDDSRYHFILNQELLAGASKVMGTITGNDSLGGTYTISITNLIPNSTEVFGKLSFSSGYEFNLTASEFDEETGFPTYIYVDFTAGNLLPADISSYNITVGTSIGETDITNTETGQALISLHTNYPSTTITSDANIQVTYYADIKNYIDNKIATIQAAIVNNV